MPETQNPFQFDLHIYTYMQMLDKHYGENVYLDFEPETFAHDLGVSGKVLDRIMCGLILKTSSRFWNDIVVFEKVALGLNNRTLSFDTYQDLSPAEMAWAVIEAGMITNAEPIDMDVAIYIAKKLSDDGFSAAPVPFVEIQPYLDRCNSVLSEFDTNSIVEERKVIENAKTDAIYGYVEQCHKELIDEEGLV